MQTNKQIESSSNASDVTLTSSETESDWIPRERAREITGRANTSLQNWIKSEKLPTRKSEKGVTLISMKHLLDLHASARKSRTVKPQESQEIKASVVHGNNGNDNEPVEESVAENECELSKIEASKTGNKSDESDEANHNKTLTDFGQISTHQSESSAPEEKIMISSINFDEDTQIREHIQEQIVTEYAELMKQGNEFPPVILFRDNETFFIGDGWHRIRASQKNGYSHFLAQVYDGGKPAAIRYSLKSNITHGLRLTNADKRKKVKVALQEYPTLSTNEIANICGVSESLARSIRDRFVKNEPGKRIGADGKEYPARKKERGVKNTKKLFFKRTVTLTKKLTMEELKRLKEVIEKRLQSLSK